MTALLKLTNIAVAYGDVPALFDVSMEVKSGSITSVIGSNGAGKSTLLRSIVGLNRIHHGSIFFQSTQIDRQKTEDIVKSGISLVPEGRHLFPRLTVTQNLIIGSYYNKNKQSVLDEIEFVFQIFPRLKERHRQLAGTLSGGEQQMASIARGLMAKPQLLIIDEMSLGLAPIIVEELFDLMIKIRSMGLTILLVEQDVTSALSIADYAYVMQTGRIVLEGASSEVLNANIVKTAYLGL
ncbi:MAG: ABC transporter ATP-binding protein [Chloroflexi bacterium]|jgi:branched-chain amino acid transport system ATP-binding protein|nr:ABC transporter ATP-binding protein [Chloroflexota bacterium]